MGSCRLALSFWLWGNWYWFITPSILLQNCTDRSTSSCHFFEFSFSWMTRLETWASCSQVRPVFTGTKPMYFVLTPSRFSTQRSMPVLTKYLQCWVFLTQSPWYYFRWSMVWTTTTLRHTSFIHAGYPFRRALMFIIFHYIYMVYRKYLTIQNLISTQKCPFQIVAPNKHPKPSCAGRKWFLRLRKTWVCGLWFLYLVFIFVLIFSSVSLYL